MIFVYVLIGGGIGAISRFSLGKIFPYTLFGIQSSTLLANMLGCLIAGVSLHFLQSLDSKALWIIGFCGALTTFSSYMIEMAQLFEAKSFTSLLLLWVLHHGLCFLLFYIGYKKLPLLFIQ
ncbi:MAG: CrcB family protein [Bdellovibrionales bacterium]|nr:CrcB family protein [Bdellovibrionales bacterium]